MDEITLIKLLDSLEFYLNDDINDLQDLGFKDRPGSALESAKKQLEACKQWKQKLKEQ